MKKTEIVRILSIEDGDLIRKAGELLRQNKLVAFPTETVYGIGANALSKEAVAGIFEAKGRPSDNPLIVHIGEIEEVDDYADCVSRKAQRLMSAYWPGPLTLIFKKKAVIPDAITAGLDTVAIRCPGHDIARAIILASDCPIAAPSANISGKPSPTTAGHVIEDLKGKVDMIVDGGHAPIGLESTVVDMSVNPPVILRPGWVTRKMIEDVIGEVSVDKVLVAHEDASTPKAPGMKYKHYAPEGQLLVYEGEKEKAIEAINSDIALHSRNGIRCGVIAFMEDKEKYKCDVLEVLGSISSHDEIASNLFKVLRVMDDLKVERIYTQSISEEDIGWATMNRLMKAAGNKKIVL